VEEVATVMVVVLAALVHHHHQSSSGSHHYLTTAMTNLNKLQIGHEHKPNLQVMSIQHTLDYA
jgi:hypothetical protein